MRNGKYVAVQETDSFLRCLQSLNMIFTWLTLETKLNIQYEQFTYI